MPFVLHGGGGISTQLKSYYSQVFAFIETPQGKCSNHAVLQCIQYLDR